MMLTRSTVLVGAFEVRCPSGCHGLLIARVPGVEGLSKWRLVMSVLDTATGCLLSRHVVAATTVAATEGPVGTIILLVPPAPRV
jgi:hypothetical protein